MNVEHATNAQMIPAGVRAPSIMTTTEKATYRDLVPLSARELVVFKCWKEGLTCGDTRLLLAIEGMVVGKRMVRYTRASILQKLGAETLQEALRIERMRGVRI